jgi:Protein of unknown function (DUF1524)
VPLRTPKWTLLLAAATLSLSMSACEDASLGPGAEPTSGSTTTGSTKDSANAEAQLAKLKVAKAGTMKDYSREKFPHWRSTGSNCDVRDSVLKRDGQKVKFSGCNVVAGTWKSFYDGKTLDSPTLVDIDHTVPLANAWRTGAAAWTDDKRGDFANDLDDPQLLAVSASSNRSKGDQDPSTWKPTDTSAWCEYAQDWIAVKAQWKLWVTTAEKSALDEMLRKC